MPPILLRFVLIFWLTWMEWRSGSATLWTTGSVQTSPALTMPYFAVRDDPQRMQG